MTNDDLDPCLLAPLPLGVMSEEIERLRTALAERDATIERLTKERDEVLANHQWAQDRLDDAEARAIAAEEEVELLKAAIFGAPNYDADLTTGCFVEMARSVEAARQGALDRATAAERERDEAREQLRMQWCLACGSVSADGKCDCTDEPDTANLREAVDYATEFGKMVREVTRERDEARAEVERLKRLLEPLKPKEPRRPEYWRVGQKVRYLNSNDFAWNAGNEAIIIDLRNPGTPAGQYQVFWTTPINGSGKYWTTPADVELVEDCAALTAKGGQDAGA